MRLGTCIALELACVAGVMAGVGFGVGHAVSLAGDYIGAREAVAATQVTISIPPPPALERLPTAAISLEVAPEAPSVTTVFGATDEELLEPLGATAVVNVKPNKGGTSLSMRMEFASGARASYKPRQIHPQSDPRREIAAYRMDRLLGIGHVPPAKPFKIKYQQLLAAADPSFRTYTISRILEEVLASKGEVKGMVAWWIPEIRDAKIGEFQLDEPAGMKLWASYLQVGATIPDDVKGLIVQIATVVVFDVLIDNADRWSGGNAKASVDGKTLYFMDNTLSFSRFKRGHESNLRPLQRIQVFPRTLITRLRELTRATVEDALDLGDDPVGMAPLLDDQELDAVMSRRDHILRYVDALIAEHGEDAVLALP